MRCDGCGEDRPLEDFEVGLMRPALHSHEMQALDRMRREPKQLCRSCYRPSAAVSAADAILGADDSADVHGGLDLLADVVDWFRRRRR
jgi:hypothetical protein